MILLTQDTYLISPYRANAEISRVQNAAKTELAGLQAALKREKTKNSSLQQSLDQKVSDDSHSHNRKGFELSGRRVGGTYYVLLTKGETPECFIVLIVIR